MRESGFEKLVHCSLLTRAYVATLHLELYICMYTCIYAQVCVTACECVRVCVFTLKSQPTTKWTVEKVNMSKSFEKEIQNSALYSNFQTKENCYIDLSFEFC